MLERIKGFFSKKTDVVPTYKHILITIHGFGRKRSHEMHYIKELGEKHNYLVVTFDMFEVDEKNPNYEDWIAKAEKVVQNYISQGYVVDLLGFSMGGVIAGYLASKYPIHRLVLIAPAFDYLSLNSAGKLVAFSALSMFKDSEMKFVKDLQARILPPEYFPQFFELVKQYKKYISEVNCPVLFLHGEDDETVPLSSSKNAFASIKHLQKRLLIIPQGKHQLSLDETLYEDLFAIIDLFLAEVLVKNRTDSEM